MEMDKIEKLKIKYLVKLRLYLFVVFNSSSVNLIAFLIIGSVLIEYSLTFNFGYCGCRFSMIIFIA